MKIILLSILLLLYGCAIGPINSIPLPQSERLELIKAIANRPERADGEIPSLGRLKENEKLAQLYLQAKKAFTANNLDLACDLFLKLSNNQAFPLHQMALIHTFSSCQYSGWKLKRLWKKTTPPSYLKEIYCARSLELATNKQLDESIAEFSFEMSYYKKVQSEKIQLLTNAISIAKKLKLKEKEEKYFKRLIEISPLYSPEVTPENLYLVARDFELNRQFEKARDLYLNLINGNFPLKEKIKAYNSYRNSFKVARQLKIFVEKTAEMELFLRQLLDESPEDTSLQEAWVDSKITYARAIWTEHMNLEAREQLSDVLNSKLGNPNQLANLYWVFGSLYLEIKENSKALLMFEQAAKYQTKNLDLQENIQWAVVWNKYLQGKYAEMVKDIEDFTAKSSNQNFISKLNFWKAKAKTKQKNHINEAEPIFAAVATSDPFGYYGLLASMEIGIPLPALPATEITTTSSGNLILDWLIAMDEKVSSSHLLKELNPTFKTIADREKAMLLYAQTGWYQGGMAQITNFPLKMRDELTRKYISIVFPTPYKDIVENLASKYQIPPALTFAIARQESAFNPEVRSWADAFGLMQIIPEKANALSKKYEIAYFGYSDLYRPELNIELGTALLAELKKNFAGKFVQNVAAYNASTSAINVWEKERLKTDYLEFIEMIPYEETRNYIKLVFRNYITYQRILAKKENEIIIPKDFFSTPY